MSSYIIRSPPSIRAAVLSQFAVTRGTPRQLLPGRRPYAGQSLGPFTGIVLDTVLRRKQRRYLGESEKEEVLERQGKLCNLCGDRLGSDTVYDHTIALHQLTAPQDIDAYQALCGQCHVDKTKTEPRPCVGILRSHLNKELWQSYVLSPKIPCLA